MVQISIFAISFLPEFAHQVLFQIQNELPETMTAAIRKWLAARIKMGHKLQPKFLQEIHQQPEHCGRQPNHSICYRLWKEYRPISHI